MKPPYPIWVIVDKKDGYHATHFIRNSRRACLMAWKEFWPERPWKKERRTAKCVKLIAHWPNDYTTLPQNQNDQK